MFLQTYIEYLRGKIEDKKEMNHHGKSVVVDTSNDVIPVVLAKYAKTAFNSIQYLPFLASTSKYDLSMKWFNGML